MLHEIGLQHFFQQKLSGFEPKFYVRAVEPATLKEELLGNAGLQHNISIGFHSFCQQFFPGFVVVQASCQPFGCSDSHWIVFAFFMMRPVVSSSANTWPIKEPIDKKVDGLLFVRLRPKRAKNQFR
jgi:hypothetical protein